ncbi:MAG TPA: hypothetical protein ACFYD3_04615 [Candidatus Hypogeohydataceae bacterium YC41]
MLTTARALGIQNLNVARKENGVGQIRKVRDISTKEEAERVANEIRAQGAKEVEVGRQYDGKYMVTAKFPNGPESTSK